MNYPKVSIILLNWNGMKDTLECLESVYQIDYPNFDVVVADNGSRDEQAAAIKRHYPQITLIENGANLGFADGNNVAIRQALTAGADYLFLLNNDTVVDPHVLSALVAGAQAYPDAGIYGAKIYYHAHPQTLWYAGAQWDARTNGFAHIGMGQMDDGVTWQHIREVDYITGCALFFSRNVANTVGLLDGQFFVYFEETDWCYRARNLGFKCLYVPDAKVWHKVSASTGGATSTTYNYYMSRNLLLFIHKNFSGIERFRKYIGAAASMFFPGAASGFALAGQHPWIKRLYWDLQALPSKATKFKLFGLIDFSAGRFGRTSRTL